MNFLAHLVLSDGSDEALLGSLLGDFVKGNPAGRFEPAVYAAIRLHRKIDSFTDAHALVRRSRQRVSAPRRRFAGIIVDVCYDHFLSRHWAAFCTRDRDLFIERVYCVLTQNRSLLPERLVRILPRMVAENWLGSYIHCDKLGEALDRIAGRLGRGEHFLKAANEIEANYRGLESDFLAFFPDLIAFSAQCKGGLTGGCPPV